MELTWKDIKEIIGIADKLVEETRWCDLINKGEQAYYEKVLEIYTETTPNDKGNESK